LFQQTSHTHNLHIVLVDYDGGGAIGHAVRAAYNGTKYFSESFIYVANDTSMERQKAVDNNDSMQRRKKAADDWVARILEIRASDEHHVYARVYWMYWPDELPQGRAMAKDSPRPPTVPRHERVGRI
jgi:hypothetical protein